MTFEQEFGEAFGKTLRGKYALKKDGKYIENSYLDIINRITAKVKRYKNTIMSEDDIAHLHSMLVNKRVVLGGSITASYGTALLTSLSNCYVIPSPEDNYDSICKIDNMLVDIMKRRGGVGTSLDNIRPRGSVINNAASTSTGLVPFMKRYSNTTLEVSQEGRRGALMLALSYKHKDATHFVDAKTDTISITGANISLKVDEDFFLSEHSTLRKKAIMNMWKNAEPGLLFWDTVLDNPIDAMKVHKFSTTGTNPCGEIPLNPYGSCLLAHLNWYSYVENKFTSNARIDVGLIKRDTEVLTKFMNTVVEEELKHLDKILKVSEPGVETELWTKIKAILREGRRIGIGKTGIGDFLAALNLSYGNRDIVDKISRIIKVEVIKTSLDLDIEAPILKIARNRKAFMNHKFMKDTLKVLGSEYKNKVPANIGFLTVAPVGTGSMIAGVTSGMEPAFALHFKRRRRATTEDTIFKTDKNGEGWVEFETYHPPFLEWAKIAGYNDNPMEHVDKSPYYKNTAEEIDVYDKIDLQATLQKHTDQSISVTHNVKRNFPLEEVHKLVRYAYDKKLKGFTLYRDGSREGILKKFGSTDLATAKNRPTLLMCEVHNVKIDGKDWVVLVGLIDDKPYELFALKVKGIVLKKITNAKLEKIKGNKQSIYNLISTELIINDIISHYSSGTEEVFTRLISTLLSNGVEVKDILKSFDKVTMIVGTFENVIKRVLGQYTGVRETNEECPKCGAPLVIENGCTVCKSCGYDKCG